MENAIDALKIAFGVLIFAIALVLAFSVVGQARATSETILLMNDKTKDYEYVDVIENNASDEDRIVGFETILPTIYRYAKEQYAVTILKQDGTPIVRYDLFTEGLMNDWDNLLAQYRTNNQEAKNKVTEVKARINKVDKIIQGETGKRDAIWSSLATTEYYSGTLYRGRNKNISSSSYCSVAPWMGNSNDDIVARIKSDIEGTTFKKNNIEYYGSGKKLNQYSNRKFKEKFIEIQTSGTTITVQDDNSNIEYSLETVKGNNKLEIIYILQP